MNCDANSGNMQHNFGELRGYGHDKSAPTPTERTWKNTLFIKHTWQNIQQNGIKRISEETM